MTVDTPEITALSRLDAVNMMLAAVGQLAVSTLEADDASADSEQAQAVLANVIRQVGSEGWHYNTELKYPLTPDEDGYLNLPANTLMVDTVYTDYGLDVVMRGSRLYDRTNHTFVFSDQTTYLVDLVVSLPFEDLTPTTRWYIAVKATRMFAADKLMRPDATRYKLSDELQARALFEAEDARNDDRTLAATSSHIARMRRR